MRMSAESDEHDESEWPSSPAWWQVILSALSLLVAIIALVK